MLRWILYQLFGYECYENTYTQCMVQDIYIMQIWLKVSNLVLKEWMNEWMKWEETMFNAHNLVCALGTIVYHLWKDQKKIYIYISQCFSQSLIAINLSSIKYWSKDWLLYIKFNIDILNVQL